MSEYTYFDDLASGWDGHDYATEGTYFTGGLQPATGGWITALGWRRDSVTGPGPTNLSLWNQGNQGRILSLDTPVDDGNPGWQWTPCEPTPVIGFSAAVVGCHGPNGFVISERGATPPPFPAAGWGRSAAVLNWRKTGSDDTLSGSSALSPIFALDARISTSITPDVSGATQTQVHTELARYLESTGDLYIGSPLADTKTVVEQNFNALSDPVSGLVAQQSQLNELLSRLTADAAAKLTLFLDDYGINSRGFFDRVTAQLQDVTDAQADLIIWFGEFTGIPIFTYLGELLKFLNGLSKPPYRDPASFYDPVDSVAFTDNLEWHVQADLYTVDVVDFDPAGTSEPFGTLTRYGYLGKWSILDVDHASEWHFFNTPKARLEQLGYTMPGLALILNRPGSGTVTAWKLKVS